MFAVLDQLRLIQQFGQFARIVAIVLIPRRGLARSDILRKIAFKKVCVFEHFPTVPVFVLGC